MADHTDSFMRRAEARIGETLREKWRLDRLLGVGGMAAVYAATHRNGKRGAVKLLHPAIAHDPDARSRFLREGYVANRIGHPGVVAVLDDDTTDDGSVFLVMELLQGQSVDSLLDASPGQRLEPRLAVDIVCQLLDVLSAAHDQGVVHRDLKPENLFMTQQNLVKVLDFGIARLRDANNDNRTQTGSVMGTPAFMPPEQALGDWNRVDHRSDLWAAGATLFTMISGRHVHEAETVNKLLLAAMTKHAPPLASVVPGVHPELARIVDKSLALEPQARFQSALEMRLALLSLHDRAPATVAPGFDPQLAATMAESSSMASARVSAAQAQVTLAVPVGDPWQPPSRSVREGTLSAASRSTAFTQPPGQRSYMAAVAVTAATLLGGAGFFVWKLNSGEPRATESAATSARESPTPATATAPTVAPAVSATTEPTATAPTAPVVSASASAITTASAAQTLAPKVAPRPPAAQPLEPPPPPAVRTPGNFDGRY